MADDEDRAGNATKYVLLLHHARLYLIHTQGHCKKIPGSCQLLRSPSSLSKVRRLRIGRSILRIIIHAHLTPSQTESKSRYAKWKAVDIVKAFREGRRPAPGDAGSQLDPDPSSSLPSSDQLISDQQSPTPPKPVPRERSPPTKSSSRSPRRQSPTPSIPPVDIERANRLLIVPGEDKHDNEALSPGRWSTTATPGFDLARTPGLGGIDSTAGSSDSLNNWHEHLVDPLTRAAAQAGSSTLRTAWVSTEMEGVGSDVEVVEDTTLNRGRVRFSFDTPGTSSPPKHASASPHFRAQEMSPPPPRVELPPGFVPTGVPTYTPADGFGSPIPGGPAFVASPPPPPHAPHFSPPFSVPQLPLVPHVPSAPPVSLIASPHTDPIHVPPYPAPPPREVELTPKLIAKAQKHCRFAISALDYEDTQHAIRELRAALEMLGASV